jgi:hypothetical protein
MFLLCNAKTDQVWNRRFLYLIVKKLFVIPKQLCYGFFSKETISFISNHGLFEEKIDPLSYIVLIQNIIFDRVEQYPINKLANSSDRMLLGQVWVLIKAWLEWKN